MIKKENIKFEFERLVRYSFVNTPLGRERALSYSIVIGGSFKASFVALVAKLRTSACPYVVSRSYPMSYKSAYRLVCSL